MGKMLKNLFLKLLVICVDPDQTVVMHRLILIQAGLKCYKTISHF